MGKKERKGWKSLVDDAVTRVIEDEVSKQVRDALGSEDYVLQRAVNEVGKSVMTASPAIRELVEKHMLRILRKSFEDMELEDRGAWAIERTDAVEPKPHYLRVSVNGQGKNRYRCTNYAPDALLFLRAEDAERFLDAVALPFPGKVARIEGVDDERLNLQVQGWEESARHHCESATFYRGLIEQIGNKFGTRAYFADDGSKQDHVLALKVPELVEEMLLHLGEFRGGLSALDNAIAVQQDDGNWNYDAYMHGMLNALLFAKSCFTGEDPEYRKAPEQWLCDNPDFKGPVPEHIGVSEDGQEVLKK